MPNLKDLPVGERAPMQVNAVIEIPKGTHVKIEYKELEGEYVTSFGWKPVGEARSAVERAMKSYKSLRSSNP